MRNTNWFRAVLVSLSIIVGFLPASALLSQGPADPAYVRISNGWMGLYGHDSEYAKFSVVGKEVELQDAHHILLRPGLGMMVSFADEAEFGGGANLLENHAKWELDYWRSHANSAEAITRQDLSGPRQDLRVTELRIHRNDDSQIIIYMIALAAKDGVFVLSVSPGSPASEGVVREIADSFILVHRPLNAEEIATIAKAAK